MGSLLARWIKLSTFVETQREEPRQHCPSKQASQLLSLRLEIQFDELKPLLFA